MAALRGGGGAPCRDRKNVAPQDRTVSSRLQFSQVQPLLDNSPYFSGSWAIPRLARGNKHNLNISLSELDLTRAIIGLPRSLSFGPAQTSPKQIGSGVLHLRLMDASSKPSMQHMMPQLSAQVADAVTSAKSPPTHERTPVTSPRSLSQLSIFFAGAACFVASAAITRRAIHRRHLRIKPNYYDPNTNPHEHFSPFQDAVQALNLATINCFSLGAMGVGGTLWAFDISGLTEMRAALRGRLGYESFESTGQDKDGPVGTSNGTSEDR